MIEFLAECSLDCVNCIECKRDARPKIVSFVHLSRLQSLKNKTNFRHQVMDYSSKRLAIRSLFNGNYLFGFCQENHGRCPLLKERAQRENVFLYIMFTGSSRLRSQWNLLAFPKSNNSIRFRERTVDKFWFATIAKRVDGQSVCVDSTLAVAALV